MALLGWLWYHLLQLEETYSHRCSILKEKDPSQVMINVSCRGVRAEVQVCRRELHTHIHLDYARIEFLSCIYIYIYIKKKKKRKRRRR